MTNANTDKLTVLIVEDDRAEAELVVQEVSSLGWTSTVVGTVQAARAKFASGAFDIVVLDRTLDDLEDGLALLCWFRALESAAPGVLVASRLGAAVDHVKALDLGADDYINKPYDVEVLNARLRALARRLTGQRAPESVDLWEDLEIRVLNCSACGRDSRFRCVHNLLRFFGSWLPQKENTSAARPSGTRCGRVTRPCLPSSGWLHERVNDAEVARSDELADLARHINAALDENARLMTGLGSVSQTAAHEINKELGHLRNLAEANRQPELVESADALLRLLREILELSRVESSADALMTSVNLEEVVQSATALYRDAFNDANIQLVARTQEAVVLGQVHLLTNAVANLLNNALRHSPVNGRVVVAVEKLSESATVSVADDGGGTESDDLREILRCTRQGDVAGYGFGLRFVQAVSIRHGAKMRLANMNPGFKVSLTFPVTKQ